ncbi:alpha/beta hydrolase [Streptomyces sp. NPDC047315]|uniref:alpha/beta hydrolase family protein n=1 Tax=Streptomyces sp. NPDC047315 TaxID=3155142 RepID=UPI0033C5CA57
MMRLTRTATAVALSLSLALPVAVASSASAASAPSAAQSAQAPRKQALQLPRPTGQYGVGSSVLHLVDRSRKDPWVPTADGRELLVTVHYPGARRGGGGAPARYATTAEARAMVDGFGVQGVPPEVLSATRTHSRVGARPAPGKFPLVVLSPGFSASRFTLTNVAEDLASRGYVVALVDHAYESFGTSMPGGRTLPCVACKALDVDGVPASVVTSTRAKDVSFLLDRLTGRQAERHHPDWSKLIDRRRIGMAGHSIGGASAASTMAGDRRVLAGVNMDGAFWEDLPPQGLSGRPFMMLGTDDDVHRPGGRDTTWDRMWPTLDGWKRWLTVAGSDHGSFSDFPLILAHFGQPQPPLPAPRAADLVRTYLAAFFDQHLKGVEQPVLAGPSAQHPEVVFHHQR